MKVGDHIKEIREREKGIKKEDIAKMLGITTKAYSNIESNITDITLTRLEEIADYLGCKPDYIINYKDRESYSNHFNNYDGNQGVNIMYQGQNPEQIQKLHEQLQESQKKMAQLEVLLNNRTN
jgi:transcriptional regulator with XRE-family HTH domain